MTNLRTELSVVRGKGGGATIYTDGKEVWFNCPWYPVESCPFDGRETCSTKPCRMCRMVKR